MPYNPLDDLKATNALLEGHFQLTSGRHSDGYAQCALYLAHPKLAEKAGQALAEKLRDKKIDTVVSPALGGLIIGHETARALGVRGIFTERKDGEMTLRRGFSLKKGERVVIVEDVVTTGKSTNEVARLLRELGAEVVSLACVVDRRGDSAEELSVPLVSLIKLDIKSWLPEECPLCKAGSEAYKPGSRTAP
ncbi:orotate phosphoribosyltransferase [bacterium]|nr:orotate phosphoribosyltransferase [bacterium]